MRPRIELSKQKNFVVWESGSYNPKTKEGYAIIVGGPKGERCQVIFDINSHKKSNDHYLFFAELGTALASCKFVEVGENVKVTLELLVIDALTQLGADGVDFKLNKLWSCALVGTPAEMKEKITPGSSILVLPDIPGVDVLNAEAMLCESYAKAMTSKRFQRLFWGIPRPSQVAQATPTPALHSPRVVDASVEEALDVEADEDSQIYFANKGTLR